VAQVLVGEESPEGKTESLDGKDFVAVERVCRQVALFIMDTQGAFGCNSTITDCTTIFVLSFLLSSIQIYNVSSDVTERDLEQLQVVSVTRHVVVVKPRLRDTAGCQTGCTTGCIV